MFFDSVVFVEFTAVCHHLLLLINIMLLHDCFCYFGCCLSPFVCLVACLFVVFVLFAVRL